MRELWERQQAESSKAYAAFSLYLGMGKDRSLRKLLEDNRCSTKLAQLGRWSSRWRWVERAQAYDDHLDRQERAKTEAYRRKMNERHRATAAAALGKVVEWLQNVQGTNLRPLEAARVMEVAAKLERLAVGEPTEIGKTEHAGDARAGPDYSKMSDAELREDAISALVNSGLSGENAALIVDHMSGVKRDEQWTASQDSSPDTTGC